MRGRTNAALNASADSPDALLRWAMAASARAIGVVQAARLSMAAIVMLVSLEWAAGRMGVASAVGE